jgi:ATP-dependent RNA helicase RhlE
VEIIAQKIHPVDRDKKHPMLAHLIKSNNWTQVLVFTRTKHGANKLVEQLEKDGIGAMAIHGNKSQSARTKALSEFKDGKLQVLVATDIAARGIDIDQLPHVVNYDLPNVPEDYVHRIGRTGRAGATGEAVSLVCVDEHEMLKDIEKLIKQTLPREVIPASNRIRTRAPQPIQLRSGGPATATAQPQRRPRARRHGGANANGGNGNGGAPAAATATAAHHAATAAATPKRQRQRPAAPPSTVRRPRPLTPRPGVGILAWSERCTARPGSTRAAPGILV